MVVLWIQTPYLQKLGQKQQQVWRTFCVPYLLVMKQTILHSKLTKIFEIKNVIHFDVNLQLFNSNLDKQQYQCSIIEKKVPVRKMHI